jgi:hypothetical protein
VTYMMRILSFMGLNKRCKWTGAKNVRGILLPNPIAAEAA